MPGPPHLAHATLPQLLLEPIAPQLSRRGDLAAQPVDNPGAHIGKAHASDDRSYRGVEVRRRVDRDLDGQIQKLKARGDMAAAVMARPACVGCCRAR